MMGSPFVIPTRMIRYPIDYQFHIQRMRLLHQLLKILQRTKFFINLHITAAGIITT